MHSPPDQNTGKPCFLFVCFICQNILRPQTVSCRCCSHFYFLRPVVIITKFLLFFDFLFICLFFLSFPFILSLCLADFMRFKKSSVCGEQLNLQIGIVVFQTAREEESIDKWKKNSRSFKQWSIAYWWATTYNGKVVHKWRMHTTRTYSQSDRQTDRQTDIRVNENTNWYIRFSAVEIKKKAFTSTS